MEKIFGIITIKTHKSVHFQTHQGNHLVALFFLAQLFQEIQITPPKYQVMPPKQKEVFKWESSWEVMFL